MDNILLIVTVLLLIIALGFGALDSKYDLIGGIVIIIFSGLLVAIVARSIIPIHTDTDRTDNNTITVNRKETQMIIAKTVIAKVAHAVNRAYCLALGDDSQPKWADAPDWQKESAINGVTFHALYPNADPSQSHENWMKEKEEAGWKYGPVKDPEKKEHPCMVPYEELPLEQRVKDYLFKAVVDEMGHLF
jgi:hypothetical protein